jgi:hypothetical protein
LVARPTLCSAPNGFFDAQGGGGVYVDFQADYEGHDCLFEGNRAVFDEAYQGSGLGLGGGLMMGTGLPLPNGFNRAQVTSATCSSRSFLNNNADVRRTQQQRRSGSC